MSGIKKYVAGAAVAAIAGGGLLLAVPAFATNGTAPAPWEPDPQAIGSVVFYNAAGQPVTQGNNLDNAFAYVAADGPVPSTFTGATKASLVYAFPTKNTPTSSFLPVARGLSTTFPTTTAPANINAITNPVNTVGSSGGSSINAVRGNGNSPDAGYTDVLQVRLGVSGSGGINSLPSTYWASDIQYDPVAGTWQEIANDDNNVTYTALTATPTSGPAGTSVALHAVITSESGAAVAGSVQFYDGTTAIGTPVAVAGGVANSSTSSLSVATHNLAAIFTPTDGVANTASTGFATETVTGPATSTAAPTVNPTGTGAAGVATTISTTVTQVVGGAGVTAGTVEFYDNGISGTDLGAGVGGAGGVYTLSLPSGLAAGGHSVTAVFTPTDPAADAASTSTASVFSDTVAASGACAVTGSNCGPDVQDIEGAIPVGTLTISTPYNGTGCAAGLTLGTTPNVNSATSTAGCVGGVLNIGTLALTPTDTEFTAHTTFQDIAITDNRAGNLPWTVQASSSDLTDGTGHPQGTIDSQNVGLTAITSTAGTGFLGTVTPVDNPAAEPAVAPGAALGAPGKQGLGGPTVGVGGLAHTIATADHGLGSDTLNGTITLNAPTSTENGLFTGTITFTVLES
ncbi:Ig-like domain-containing protein [Jatrophihabitans sp.]|uniref:Ig-like domain-containing protein n=1 Tax=Jatrophihabitans sp. TaxID=1932789 RepID=UPI0030C683E5|nr:repeat-containing protein [Jatrophihabitans sp.]